MKCFACGYEKHGNLGEYQDVPVYYQRGSKQGQLKETRREWVDPEKDMPDVLRTLDSLLAAKAEADSIIDSLELTVERLNSVIRYYEDLHSKLLEG